MKPYAMSVTVPVRTARKTDSVEERETTLRTPEGCEFTISTFPTVMRMVVPGGSVMVEPDWPRPMVTVAGAASCWLRTMRKEKRLTRSTAPTMPVTHRWV